MENKPFVVACIPAYNEESALGGVLIRTRRHVDKIVVCDDGSRDLTGEIAGGLGAVVVSHKRNMGYGASIRTLFSEALRQGADVVVTLDGDGQHDPNEIPRLIERLAVGDVDIVVGSRFLEDGTSHAPRWRRAGIRLITELASNGSLELTDAQSGFRAYTRKALESIVLTEQGMGVSTEILLKAGINGLKVAEVPVNITYGKSSSTHNPIVHGFEVVLTTVKYLSLRKPLLFYGLPGLIALTTALFFWVWTLQIFAATRRVVTNVALIALGSTLIGLMLMTTAVILWVIISVMQEQIG